MFLQVSCSCVVTAKDVFLVSIYKPSLVHNCRRRKKEGLGLGEKERKISTPSFIFKNLKL